MFFRSKTDRRKDSSILGLNGFKQDFYFSLNYGNESVSELVNKISSRSYKEFPMGKKTMRKLTLYSTWFALVFLITISTATADPFSDASPWYCTLRGNDKGALKVTFDGSGSLSGVGATATRGTITVSGTYELAINGFFGNYHIEGDFGNDDEGSFEGKISKRGNKFNGKMVSNSGYQYKIIGLIGPPNVMIDGSYRCTVRGKDKGYYEIESSPSGIDDMFYLSGTGETVNMGSAFIQMYGHGDGKGSIYGRWVIDGDYGSDYGPFSGRCKMGKMNIKAVNLGGKIFRLQGIDRRFLDVVLDVPYVPNYGMTCGSSSFTMVLKYYDPSIRFDEVFGILGLPPFSVEAWKEFERWVEEDLNLEMETYHQCEIDHVIRCIDYGYPVVVLQWFNKTVNEGHYRVVIGYNLGKEILILNDPSPYGPRYRMEFQLFDSLWDKNFFGTTRVLFLIFPKGSENPLSDLIPYSWY